MYYKIKEFSFKDPIVLILIFCLFFLIPTLTTEAQTGSSTISDYDPNRTNVLAFPGAEGFGRYTTGGRGGLVIKVTNLNDSGPGSFREALEQKGPRIVVFEVSGTIELKSNISVRDSNLTIAGQTAPGDGITIKNYRLTILGKNNIIIRFLRFRLGDLAGREENAIFIRDCSDIILDHCTFSWGTDETATNFRNSNVSFQWNIVSEGLHNSVHKSGPHGYGAIWGGKNVSYHHNLIAHFNDRSPRFDHPGLYSSKEELEKFRGVVDFRNNVIYNWDQRASNGGEEGTFNLINNYYKPGPAKKNTSTFLFPLNNDYNYGKFYIKGNILENNSIINVDNWLGVQLQNPTLTETLLQNLKISSPLPSDVYEHNHTAQEAYQKVLDFAGASLVRDAVDLRIIKETRNGTYTYKGSNGSTNGIIDSQKDVGGWPSLKSSPAPKDTDGDGIPDAWEIANNLDPNTTNDREYNLSPYYTDIEVYINSLVQDIIDQTNPGAPGLVEPLVPNNNATVSPVDISFSWSPKSTATHYRIQISKASNFSSNVITIDNIKNLSHIRAQLDQSSTYYWRIRASNSIGNGQYSAPKSFKTGTLNTVPDKPVLLFPQTNETGISVSPNLTWSKVPNTKEYRLQVATNSSFSSMVLDQRNLLSPNHLLSGLKDNTTYYWRVRAINDSGNGSYSQTGTFKTANFDVVPDVTILTRPAHNTIVYPVSIRLEWEPNPTAQYYTLQLSTSSDFSNTSNYLINQKEISDNHYFIDNLKSNTTYHWRIRAYNNKGTDYDSKPFSFKTSAFSETPSNIVLVEPIHDSNIFSKSIKFSWDEPIAKSYRLQVSTSSNFSSYVANISGITTKSYTVSNLTANTQYYWRVIPSNESGVGTASEIRKVRSSTYTSSIAEPKPISPIKGAGTSSDNIQFTWENVPTAEFYRIQISNKSDFSNLIVNETDIRGTTYLVPNLNNNTTYYWRVRGWTSKVIGSYSQAQSFKTGTATANSEKMVLLSPNNNSNNQSLSLYLSWNEYPNAESYNIEVSESNAFSSHSVKQSGVSITSFALQNLKSGTKYYWRVTPVVNGSQSSPSDTWVFSTESSAEALPFSEGLVAHWKMEEGSGNVFMDHSGNGNNASIPNPSGVNWIAGKVGQGANFNASTGSFGSVAHNPSIDITEQITIAAWIRPKSIENNGILSKLSGDGYEFRIFSDGKLEFRINRKTDGTAYRLRSNKSYIADGKTWTHVAATFDGTKSTIYINGKEDNSASFNQVKIKSNTADLRIAAIGDGNRWNGGMDEVRLYNKVLSDNEILAVFNNSELLFSPPPSSELVGHWKMDEGSGNTFIDHSGNGNNATIPNPSGINWVAGKVGQGANFNASTGTYGSVAHNPTINITEQITIAAWIRPKAVENNGILSKLNGDGYEFRIFSDGKMEFRINRKSDGTAYRLRSNRNYTADGKTWTHVAATFDGTKSTIYVNGIEDNSETYNMVKINSNTADLRIGAVGDGNRWNGAMDDLRLYNNALSGPEIWNLFNGNSTIARVLEEHEKQNALEESRLESANNPNEVDNYHGFKIYPNPVQDELHVLLNKAESGKYELTIFDMMGRQYISKSATTDNGEILLDLSAANMAAGMYVLIIDHGLIGMKKIKFIKK